MFQAGAAEVHCWGTQLRAIAVGCWQRTREKVTETGHVREDTGTEGLECTFLD